MGNAFLVHSGRVKRVVLTNEEALQNDFVSIPLKYGMDEEVENIKKVGIILDIRKDREYPGTQMTRPKVFKLTLCILVL